MLKIGDNVYIVLENKLKFDALNVMEHWYAQDDIIIRCPILNTMTMDDGTILYNIRFNNEVFQLVDNSTIECAENEIRNWHSDKSGCTVLKYEKLQCNPNGDYQEVLRNSPYFAFYKYEDAVKKFRWLFRLKLSQIANNLNRLIKNMDMMIDYLDEDISVDADDYDEAVNKSKGDKYGYTEGSN